MATYRRFTHEPEDWKNTMGVGIQPGTTAISENSTKLDNLVKQASSIVFDKYKQKYSLVYQSCLRKDQIPYGIGALQPDGGIWFIDTIPIMISEAKYQGDRGNAIERWFKNVYIARLINPNITYLTFACGLGVLEHKPIYDTLYLPHKGMYNVVQPKQNTAFLKVDGFLLEEVVNIIEDTFIQTMEG